MTPEQAIELIAELYGNDPAVEGALGLLLAALTSAEADREDAELYRWIEEQRSLIIESVTPSEWTRADGSKFTPTHRVCAGQTQFSACRTLRETINLARQSK